MDAVLKFWTDAKDERAAAAVARNLQERAGLPGIATSSAYHKGGFESALRVTVDAATWPESVYALVSIGQRFGRNWIVSEPIQENAYLISNEVLIPGIRAAHLSMARQDA